MTATLKLMLVVAAAGVALFASVFSAFATSTGLPPASLGQAASRFPAALPAPASAACTDMQATDIAWVTLKANHHIDKQVPAYPSGTPRIVPVFQFNCVPDGATIVSVWSLNGQTVFSDQEPIPARGFPGLYGYDLETKDGTPLSDGQWGVQYFNNGTLLTSGTVQVGSGGDSTQAGSATVQGVVQDQDSQSPIEGAVILVLNPGVKAQDFIQSGQNESDVYTSGKSDSQGSFTLTKKIARHTAYGMVVVAQGYKPLGSNTFQIADDPEPVSITIGMTK